MQQLQLMHAVFTPTADRPLMRSMNGRNDHSNEQPVRTFTRARAYSLSPSSHRGDAEDVVRVAAVAHCLAHPAEFSCHVAEPVDRFINVMLDNRQDLVALLFRRIQQLGSLVQLHVQLPNTGALWREEEERSGGPVRVQGRSENEPRGWWCLTCEQGSLAGLTLVLQLPALRGLFAKVSAQFPVPQEAGETLLRYSAHTNVSL